MVFQQHGAGTEKANALKEQMETIINLRLLRSTSKEVKEWRLRTRNLFIYLFGENSRQVNEFSEITFTPKHWNKMDDAEIREHYLQALDTAETQIRICLDDLQVLEDRSLPNINKDFTVILNICQRFHLVATRLKNRGLGREPFIIKNEYDVQDLFYALLCLEFDDIRREEPTPSLAGSSSRMDFFLIGGHLVLEIKMARNSLRDKQIGEQLILDFAHYKEIQGFQMLICFVYDPDDFLENPRGLENDLNKNPGMQVIICPDKGFR